MLKPIPQENPEEKRRISEQRAHVRNNGSLKPVPPKLLQRRRMEEQKERGMVENVCIKVLRFIKKTKKHTAQEMSELIRGMQRSVLCLEKERQRIIADVQRKRKRK